MSKETISQTEGLCKEVATCVRNAYDRGYKQGEKDGYEYGKQDGYNRGSYDAWECARKIVETLVEPHFESGYMVNIFRCESAITAMTNNSASEAIAKIKEYEETSKVDDEIKVGDEVEHNFNQYKVVAITESGKCCCVGDVTRFFAKEDLKKTGRHFDQIEEIMKQIGVDDE